MSVAWRPADSPKNALPPGETTRRGIRFRRRQHGELGDQVVCDDCGRRERVVITIVVRAASAWPVCHDQVMRLLTETEAERLGPIHPEEDP